MTTPAPMKLFYALVNNETGVAFGVSQNGPEVERPKFSPWREYVAAGTHRIEGPFPKPEQGWQPIESAPRDGTDIDLWANGQRVTDCHWHCGQWLSWHSSSVDEEPTWEAIKNATHWMPLPAPPIPQPPVASDRLTFDERSEMASAYLAAALKERGPNSGTHHCYHIGLQAAIDALATTRGKPVPAASEPPGLVEELRCLLKRLERSETDSGYYCNAIGNIKAILARAGGTAQ